MLLFILFLSKTTKLNLLASLHEEVCIDFNFIDICCSISLSHILKLYFFLSLSYPKTISFSLFLYLFLSLSLFPSLSLSLPFSHSLSFSKSSPPNTNRFRPCCASNYSFLIFQYVWYKLLANFLV